MNELNQSDLSSMANLDGIDRFSVLFVLVDENPVLPKKCCFQVLNDLVKILYFINKVLPNLLCIGCHGHLSPISLLSLLVINISNRLLFDIKQVAMNSCVFNGLRAIVLEGNPVPSCSR